MAEKEYIERKAALQAVDGFPMMSGTARLMINRIPAADVVPQPLFEQIKWERDIAIRQLNDCGIPFGGKADVAPVVHGRWGVTQVNGVDAIFACSECSREVKATNDYFGKPTEHIAKIYPYCHCGAKMDSKGGNDAD